MAEEKQLHASDNAVESHPPVSATPATVTYSAVDFKVLETFHQESSSSCSSPPGSGLGVRPSQTMEMQQATATSGCAIRVGGHHCQAAAIVLYAGYTYCLVGKFYAAKLFSGYQLEFHVNADFYAIFMQSLS